MVINFPEADKVFCKGFWSPTQAKIHSLVLSEWRIEERLKFKEHDNDPDEKEKCLTFDVLKIDGEEFVKGEKVWQSASYRLYEAIKPILLKAQAQNIQAVNVSVTLTKKNEYVVVEQ